MRMFLHRCRLAWSRLWQLRQAWCPRRIPFCLVSLCRNCLCRRRHGSIFDDDDDEEDDDNDDDASTTTMSTYVLNKPKTAAMNVDDYVAVRFKWLFFVSLLKNWFYREPRKLVASLAINRLEHEMGAQCIRTLNATGIIRFYHVGPLFVWEKILNFNSKLWCTRRRIHVVEGRGLF